MSIIQSQMFDGKKVAPGKSQPSTALTPDLSKPSLQTANEADDNLNMQASITVPMTLNANKPQQPKKQEEKAASTEKVQKSTLTTEDRNVKYSKTGGVLSSKVDNLARKTAAQAGQKPAAPQIIQEWSCNFQQLISNMFFLDKIQTNSEISQSKCLQIFEMFRLTEERNYKMKSIEVFKNQKEATKQFQKIKYLSNLKEEKILTPVVSYLSSLCRRLLQKYPYLTIKACLKLIDGYIDLHRSKFYNGTIQLKAFVQNDAPFQNSKNFYHILNGIIQIKQHIFLQYQKLLLFLVEKKKAKKKQKSNFLQKMLLKKELMHTLVENIWQTFESILRYEFNQKKDHFSFEIDLLINCLNLCLKIDKTYFDKHRVFKTVLPSLQVLARELQKSTKTQMQNLDIFLLNLLLVHPLKIESFKNDPDLQRFFQDQAIASRYEYFLLVTNQSLFSSISPLKSRQTALFLQKYLMMSLDFSKYSNMKHKFIYSSICEIFKGDISSLIKKEQKYEAILKYIEYILNQISRSIQTQKVQYNRKELVFRFDYLNVCKLAKLITQLSSAPKENQNILDSFVYMIQHNQYVIDSFISKCIQMVRIIGYQARTQFERIQEFLQESQISTEVIYQLLYKLLIYDSKYFPRKQFLLNNEGFSTVYQFYEALICSYIINFIDKATIYHLNMQAFSTIIPIQGYSLTCQKIVQVLSSLANQTIVMIDYQNKELKLNEMQIAIQKMLDVKDDQTNNLAAFGHLIKVMLEYNPNLLKSVWVKAMIAHLKQLVNIHHPLVLYKYNQTLLLILEDLTLKKNYNFEIQNCFDFKCISLYLHNVLVLQQDHQNAQVYSKFLRSRKYDQISLGVKLLNCASTLYLKEKSKQIQKIPYEVKKMMERENRGSDYQLVFAKEANSYALPLAIIILSQEFYLDPKLNLKYPFLKDDIYQTLINFRQVSNHTHFEMNFKVSIFYNRSLQIEKNQSLKIESKLIEHIKRNPSYLSFQYLRSISKDKADIKQEMFQELGDMPTSINTLQRQSRFLLSQWKTFSQIIKVNVTSEVWKHITMLLNRIKEVFLRAGSSLDKNEKQKTLTNIFQLFISLRKKNLALFVKFLQNYHQFLLDYNINNLEQWNQLSVFNQAMFYVLNIKSIVSTQIFKRIGKVKNFQQHLKEYVSKCIQISQQPSTRKVIQNDALLIAELGIVCILDLSTLDKPQIDWFGRVFHKFKRSVAKKNEVSVREMIVMMLLARQLNYSILPENVTLKGDYWQLITVSLVPNIIVAQSLLLELQNIYDKHEIFFICFCHYFVKLAKTTYLSQLLKCSNIRLKKKFIEIIKLLLIKSINQHKSYYVVWLIQILTEIILNQDEKDQELLESYCFIRQLMFNEKTVLNRIHQLFGQWCRKIGVDCNRNQLVNDNDQDKTFTISKKLELLAYVRLKTFIFFDQKHEIIQKKRQKQVQDSQKDIISEREVEFQLFMFDLVPLFTRLLSDKATQVDAETQNEQKLKKLTVNKLRATKIAQSGLKEWVTKDSRYIWDDNYTLLHLLNEVINYEVISSSAVWISLVLEFNEAKSNLHPSIYTDDNFDDKINNLVQFLEVVIQKMQSYKRFQQAISKTLAQFQVIVYRSLGITKDLHFTNCNTLNSHIDTDFNQIAYKLSEVAYLLYKMLQNIFAEKKALKSSSALNYRKIYKNLKQVQEMMRSVDPHFAFQLKSTSIRNDSQRMSRNYTQMLHK